MAKRSTKSTAHQPTLYQKPVSKMPVGYYSSGPNPNLRRFVEEHATPYDPATDRYDCVPFSSPIIDKSDTTIYDMHPYWAKKPHGAIAEYIRHFTRPGDLIVDPFTGSGGTNTVAMQLGRPSIGLDISPAATFIAKHLCTPHAIEPIQAAYDLMTGSLSRVKSDLYETKCHRCGGVAETQYVVWSQTYQCLKCLNVIAHYDCEKGSCPRCGEKVSTRQERRGYVPVLANIICLEGCTPARIDRAIDSNNPAHVSAFNSLDRANIERIENAAIPFWHPTEVFPESWVSWRPNLAEIGDVSGFFTKRNLWAASAIADWIDKHSQTPESSWLMFCLTASIMSISKKAQHLEAGGGYIPGNYVFPPQIKERNVFNSFDSIFRKMVRGLESLNQRVATTNVMLSTQSALDLSAIPDNVVDYVFTDPPYSDKVPFGEFNFLWEVWLRKGLSWNKDEVIVNPKLGKGLDQWKQMLKTAAQEIFRVLKPGRWASICYHDSSEGSWVHLQDVFAEVGFISDKSDDVLSIQRTRMSWKQATTDNVQKRDLVLNYRKPKLGEAGSVMISGNEDELTFLDKARSIVVEILNSNPGTHADKIFDHLVSRMVRRGEYQRHDFFDLLRSVAEESSGRWYLLATADRIDEAESAKEETAAARLESFMRREMDYARAANADEGTHYSDLFEQYLPMHDKPRRLLQDWLPEYFFKTSAGTWRPPLSDEEREQKQALRAGGALRRIKRFVHALEEGVPPAERDRPAGLSDAADWIRKCRRAGLYAYGRALYEKGGFDFGVLPEEAQIEVDEDYQICVRRS